MKELAMVELVYPHAMRLSLKHIVFGLLALVLAGCQSTTDLYGYPVPVKTPSSPLGDYLAAQQARFENDTERAADFYLAALDQEPANGPVLRDRAYKLLISDGRFDAAEDIADDLNIGSLSYNLSKMVTVLTAVRGKRYRQSLAGLELVNGTGFDLLLKPITLAWSHAGLKDKEAAFEALEALKAQRAFLGFYEEHKAYLHAYFGDWERAQSTFDAALREGRLLSSRGILDYSARLSQRKAYGEAIAALDTVLSKAPQIAELAAAKRRLEAGETFKPFVKSPSDAVAEALYRTATELVRKPTATSAVVYARLSTYLNDDLTAAYILIADVYAAQRRFEQAANTLGELNEEGPLSTILVSRQAAYIERLDRRDEAAALLDEELERDPGNIQIMAELAELSRLMENFPGAIKLYDRAISQSADEDWRLFYGRGIAFEQSGDFVRAEPDLRQALALRPGDALILNYLGYSLLDRGQKVDEAVSLIDQAVNARPNDGYIVDSQGWAAYILGDYERAVTLLERAVSLVPGDPTINDHLGDAYWKAGRYIEARFKWQQVLTLGPTKGQEERIAEKIDLGLTLADSTAAERSITR